MQNKSLRNWQEIKLGEITDVRDGTHESPKPSVTGYPLVTSKHIINNKVDLTDTYLISENDYKDVNRRSKVDQYDLLLGMIGTVGEVAFIKQKPNFAIKNVGLIKTGNKTLGKYLYYYLISPTGKNTIAKSLSGSTQKFISLSQLRNLLIKIPTRDIQEKTISVLSAYDELIENNEKRIKILQEMAQRLYIEWFVKFKFPGHEKVKMVDSLLGKIPEGWEVKNFYEVVHNLDSKRKPISTMKRAAIKGPFPYYGAAKIIDYINDYIFDGRYLLVAEDGSVITDEGKPVLQFVDEKFWVSNHAHVVQGKLISTESIYLRMKALNIRPLITGAAQPKITKDNLSRVLFIIPCKSVKQTFENIVKQYLDEIFVLKKQIKNLVATRDLLIPQLVTGNRELRS